MYRFLATPRWLGLAALMITVSAVMVGLGFWQLSRYHERSAINERIDRAAATAPTSVPAVLPQARPGGGSAPPASAAWSRVTITGGYDASGEILARGRTVDGRVGFEVITPLRLSDGSAVLVDRGWVAPARGGASARPEVPAPPAGQVTVVGRVHLSESGGRAVEVDRQVRRVSVPDLARELPYPVFGAYVVADPTEPGLVAVPPRYENATQNAGYVIQWWLMAAMVLIGFGVLARRERRARSGGDRIDADNLGGHDVPTGRNREAIA